MNRKENLIGLFRGSASRLDDILKALDDEELTMYDKEGTHVDTDFLLGILKVVSSYSEAINRIFARINSLLGCGQSEESEHTKKDTGAKMAPEQVLAACTFKDNIIYLPKVQLAKKIYDEVKGRIEEAGGNWTGGKVQGFTFPFDATRVWNIIRTGKRCNLQRDYQFFETPDALADWVVSMAGEIGDGDSVLEPSAGRGALIRAIRRKYPEKTVDCYELMPENQEFLSALPGANVVGVDFMAEQVGGYDKIIANPPFSGNQDIRHVKRMYDLLNPGGTVCAITSAHWCNSQKRECTDFRSWIDAVGGHVYTIDKGVFRDSGAMVETRVLIINKKR